MNICSNLNIKNNPDKIIKMNDKFKYYNSSEINELELNKLKDLILNELNDLNFESESVYNKCITLRIWVRKFLDNNGWDDKNRFIPQDYKKELQSLNEILENKKNGKDGLCSYYARFFMFSCYAFGINCRTINWWYPGGHILNEVYVPEFRKWIAVDTLYNSIFLDENNIPLGSIELNHYKHDNKLENIKIERNQMNTYPNPELATEETSYLSPPPAPNRLLDFPWDIHFFFSPLSIDIYQYKNINYWPYRAQNITEKHTFNKEDINFDATLIKIDANINLELKQIMIKIIDYSVFNLKEFVCEIIENKKIINKFTFNGMKLELNLDKLNLDKLNCFINVYALNSRYGKSNIINITF